MNSVYMKIVGCMQVGGNCSWMLNSSLTNMSDLVDEIVLVGGSVSDDSKKIIVSTEDNPNKKEEYYLKKFKRSNAGTCINQIPLVTTGEKIGCFGLAHLMKKWQFFVIP